MKSPSTTRRGNERLGAWEFVRGGSWDDFCISLRLLLGHRVDERGCSLESVVDLVHPEDRPGFDELRERITAGRESDTDARLRVRSPAGEWHRILTRARLQEQERVVGIHLDLTELLLEESGARRDEPDFRRLVEFANEGIGILDEFQVIHFANSQLAEIFGRRPDEMVGRSMVDFVDERDLAIWQSQIALRREGERSRYEIRVTRPDGARRWVRISGAPLLQGGGSFEGSFALVTDVTERHEQERRLRDSERRLSDIVAFLPDPTLVVDRQGRLIAWNHALEEFTGVPAEDMLGRGDYEYSLPFYGDRRPLLLDLALDPSLDLKGSYDYLETSQDTFVAETQVPGPRPGGAFLWIKARRLTNSEGQVVGAIQTIRDVTRRREVERRLRESESRYRTLFEADADAIFLVEEDHFVDGNRRTGELFGVTHEELIGKTPFALSPPLQPDGEESTAKGRRYMDAVLEGEPQSFDWVHERPDGTLFDAEVNLTRVTFDDRPLVLAFLRDISERRRAEREHERLEQQLRHSQKMEAVGQLAGGVAHDFNNLLQAISGYAELIEQDLGGDHPALVNVEEISRAAERATGLTRQLLTFSRREELRQKPLYLHDLVTDLARMLRRLIGAHIDLSLTTSADVSPVMADRGQLEQVVINLCVNARDAMPSGGTVEIETRNVVLDEEFCAKHPGLEPGGYVQLRVTDDGPGISDDVRERIFEPFFTTKDVGEGTGLGLATAYAVLERHRGAIDCESTPGEGATFRVYLPAADATVIELHEKRDRQRRATGHETILVAEDEAAVRALAETVLRGAGYRVLAAKDGAEAMALIDQHGAEIDLALLDIVMPGRGGPQVAAQLFDVRPEVPIIFSSGYALGVRDARDLPGESLPKPYRPSELLERVRAALDRRMTR